MVKIHTETITTNKPVDYIVESKNYIVFFNRFKFKVSKDTLIKIVKIINKYYQYKFKIKNLFR